MAAALALLLTGLFLQQPTPVFEQKLEKLFQESGVPGAAVGVIQDGKITYSKAFGFADVEKKTPLSADMAFEIGSLSKQFTAVGILMLVQEKKLDLKDPISKHVPDLPESWRPATIEQTLHHMSGIPDYEEIAGYDFYNKPRSIQEIIDSAKSKEPAFKPGEKFYYSNTGYVLLSNIIERKAGIPVGEFFEKRVFAPVGMTSTYAITKPKHVTVPTGYHSRTSSRVAQPPIAWTSSLGAGAIVSTLNDMAKWDASLYTTKLLPDDLRNKLWETTKTTDDKPVLYGFGWFMDTFRGTPYQNHSGQTNGFTCFYNRFPGKRMSVIGFTNTYGGSIWEMVKATTLHADPGLSYKSWFAQPDSEPGRAQQHLKAIRQAVFSEGDLKLLGPGLQNFAKNERFATTRDSLKKPLDTTKTFTLLRHKTGTPVEEFIYRHTYEGGEYFWTVRLNNGLLSSLSWEDE